MLLTAHQLKLAARTIRTGTIVSVVIGGLAAVHDPMRMLALVGIAVFMNWEGASYFKERSRGADTAYFSIQIYESGTHAPTKFVVDVCVLLIFTLTVGLVLFGAFSAALS